MNTLYQFLSLIFCFTIQLSAFGQQIAVDDILCINLGESIDSLNVTDNDINVQQPYIIIAMNQDPCIFIDEIGQVYFIGGELGSECCGEHRIEYFYEGCDTEECHGELIVTIKCPKPNCAVVNLDELGSDPIGQENPCIEACEDAEAVYFTSYNPVNVYSWTVNGGTFVPGSNPAEIVVTWGASGSAGITLTIIYPNNSSEIITYCVDILAKPIADFTKSDSIICLDGSITFTNTSTGANAYFWDFGDGHYSTLFSPTHPYTTPGTYTVILSVTASNTAQDGSLSCCCTDTMSMDIVVEEFPGPAIYWVSTLCEGDKSFYWTDATECDTLLWNVFDHLGNALTFTGQGTDSICVQWGSGPTGMITLAASGCDSSYCDQPTKVIVPIVPDSIAINGLDTVCQYTGQHYQVPKWPGFIYDWDVSGGSIIGDSTGHQVFVQWGAGPTGTVQVQYYSPFLQCVPPHDSTDCMGMGILNVQIKPKFSISGSTVACVGDISFFFATSFPSSVYNWTITPAVSFSGDGTAFISVTWLTPGLYTIEANSSTGDYCNKKSKAFILVKDLAPPDSISGPMDICPGESSIYFGHSSAPGTDMHWIVTGGTPSSFTGNPISIQWNNTGPYSIQLYQQQINSPFCRSDPISKTLTPKLINGPLVISGLTGCVNSVSNYSILPTQHSDAQFIWSVSPDSTGSVIGGQGSDSIQIQWNNTAGSVTVVCKVILCGDTVTATLPLVIPAPPAPVITQTGILCPGSTVNLDAGSGYSGYAWSNFDITQTTIISAAGTYSVTVTDANGCTGIAFHQVVSAPGPVASISTPDNLVLCIAPSDGDSVVITAETNPGYSFAWYCNNALQPSVTGPSFVHQNTGVAGNFSYYVVVTQGICTSQSNNIVVVQDTCIVPPPGCFPEQHNFSFTAINQFPYCNVVDFPVSHTANVTLGTWNFGDPASNVNTGSIANAQHSYSKAGYFSASLSAMVPDTTGIDSCLLVFQQPVCIPMVANFEYSDSCGKVTFVNTSTFLPGNDINNWLWNFGDAMTSVLEHPMHTYAVAGTYTVLLTATNINGCMDTISKTVTILPPPSPAISAVPNPACVDEPIAFSATPLFTSYLWDFGDNAQNGGATPSHTYTSSGTFTVILTVTNAAGCTGIDSISVVVNPLPPQDTIAYSPSLIICEGEIVTLTAPAGYTYLWSDNQTTQAIVTDTSGTWCVTITNADGCKRKLGPVTVTVIPAPIASITGNPVICDQGCTILTASAGTGYTYQWLSNGVPLIPDTFQTIQVCDFNLAGPYSVIVTDANGCSDTSALISVSVQISPFFNISSAPDSCEGTLNTLTISPIQANVVYTWSNSTTGPTTQVFAAGIYYATGVDTTSGCSYTTSIEIHPLPDLCILPSGCYTVCDPKEICGPDDLASYQWNMNGIPLAGETNQCLTVTTSGSYSLTGTTSFGCEATSDTLILTVINCDSTLCDGLEISLKPMDVEGIDTCCFTVCYNNPLDSLFALNISSSDTDFDWDISSINSQLDIYSIGTSGITLVNSVSGNYLPTGALDSFIIFCLQDVINSPQTIHFQWLDADGNIVCEDSVQVDCPVEPPCLYMSSDTIYCDEFGTIKYSMVLCNPIDAPFPVGYVQITTYSPSGISWPSFIDLTGNPLLPGQCDTFNFVLTGANIEGDTLCYSLTAHQFYPEIDTSLCCSLDTIYCIPIPDCNPCDDVYFEGLMYNESDSCCFSPILLNQYQANYFDKIGICALSPNTSMTITNPVGGDWITTLYSPTQIELMASPNIGGFVPFGAFTLPEICVQTDATPPQLFEIKWMIGESVICRDTFMTVCDPDCGYVSFERVRCRPNGTWRFWFTITNTSNYTIQSATLVATSPASIAGYTQTVNLGSVSPGGVSPIKFINIPPPAQGGDTVCFTIVLHEVNHDKNHINCCNITYCIVLPVCSSRFEADQSIILYPNPTDGELTVLMLEDIQDENSKVHIEIFNMTGRKVQEFDFEAIDTPSIQVSIKDEISSGVYLVVLSYDGKYESARFVLLR